MPKIRWTQAQVKELYRDVRLYNSLRTKAIKKDPAIEQYLPEKLNVHELREGIATRKELKALTAYVDQERRYKFNVVYTPSGNILTERELEETRALVNIANREKRKAAKRRGIKPTGQMGSEAAAELRPTRTDVENISRENWAKFRASVEAKADPDYYQWEAETYKQNYIETLWGQLGATENVLEIVEMVEKIPAETMIAAGKQDPRLLIGFIYPNDPDEVDYIISELKTAWTTYV